MVDCLLGSVGGGSVLFFWCVIWWERIGSFVYCFSLFFSAVIMSLPQYGHVVSFLVLVQVS